MKIDKSTAGNISRGKSASEAPFAGWLMAKGRISRLLILLAMIALSVWTVSHKIGCTKKLSFYNPKDGEAFHWTEGAFHFRHAKMVSEGKSIPAGDVNIQYPEGLNTVRYITPMMDRVSGNLHRLVFRKAPLHVFLVYFMAVFSTLSVVAVFLAGKLLWRSDWAGLLSAIFYCFSAASFSRTAGGSYIREDFALPFIFFSFACFVYCLRKDGVVQGIIGSALLAVALAAWHLTQFYLLLIVAGFVIIFFLKKEKEQPRISFTIFTVVTVIVSVALPALRAKQIIISLPMMLSYGLAAALWLLPRLGTSKQKQRIAWGAVIICAFVGAGFIIQMFADSHSHIYNFIFSKVKYMGKPPEDPLALPYETKITWTASFVSPILIEIFLLLSISLPLGAGIFVWLVARIFRGKAPPGEIVAAFFALSTFFLFLIVHRMDVFTIFSHAENPVLLVLMNQMKVFQLLRFELEHRRRRIPPQFNRAHVVSDRPRFDSDNHAFLIHEKLSPELLAYLIKIVLAFVQRIINLLHLVPDQLRLELGVENYRAVCVNRNRRPELKSGKNRLAFAGVILDEMDQILDGIIGRPGRLQPDFYE